MKLDLSRIAARTALLDLNAWPRIFPARHCTTPTEAGFGSSRFSSPNDQFRVLYAAQDFRTAFAEAVVRDRFVGKQRRLLYRPYLEELVATEISTIHPLRLVDLSGPAAYEMGVDTDAKGARAHLAGQRFAQALHKQTKADGILFSSRLTNLPAIAIFDRAFAKIAGSLSINLLRLAATSDEVSRLGITIRRRAIRSS
ncbi:MAG: RES family NAD+ phosphorylase [Sphingobium sp.]|uniref:RES family NAD+ phosphorylase n=1 Tax=Sphingobium sp. TaxID=1912891 RepID=UPI003BB0BFAE